MISLSLSDFMAKDLNLFKLVNNKPRKAKLMLEKNSNCFNYK